MSDQELILAQPYAARRVYVLAILTAIMTFNYIDRILVAVLAEPIKLSFGITDFQLGLLGGPAFALVYSILSIPVARLADRTNRVKIIAITLALWSLFSSLCGLTAQYWQLLLARIGTGIGEAGFSAAAMALVSDYFPARQRATALGIFVLGAPIGTSIAALGGGLIAQAADWRMVFLALGLPGILLAVAFWVTVREPRHADSSETRATTSVGGVRALLRKTAFAHLMVGSIIGGTTMLAFLQFLTPYLARSRGLSRLDASISFGILAGIGIGIGTFLGGYLSDRLQSRYQNALALVGGTGLVTCAPLFWFGISADQQWLSMSLMFPASICLGVFIPVICAMAQGMAPISMRATAIALTLFACQFFGGVLGPPLLGLLSDTNSAHSYVGSGTYRQACAIPSATSQNCASARAQGLELALSEWMLGFLWAGAHFYRAARTYHRDSAGEGGRQLATPSA
jgi:predicted MFS family arabinose efflux permease